MSDRRKYIKKKQDDFNDKNDQLVNEIFKICKELNITINSKIPEAKNKYLSAWHKREVGT